MKQWLYVTLFIKTLNLPIYQEKYILIDNILHCGL